MSNKLRNLPTPSTIEARLLYLHPQERGSVHYLYANNQEITHTRYSLQCFDGHALRPYEAIKQFFYGQSAIHYTCCRLIVRS